MKQPFDYEPHSKFRGCLQSHPSIRNVSLFPEAPELGNGTEWPSLAREQECMKTPAKLLFSSPLSREELTHPAHIVGINIFTQDLAKELTGGSAEAPLLQLGI